MLRRQKTILAILAEYGRPVPATVLVKLAFLLRRETVLKEDAVFYDFVPHLYGPFSFALYRELDGLQRDDLVTRTDEQLMLNVLQMATIRERISELAGEVRSAVGAVVRKYGRSSLRDLLRDVYTRYPWYATHSERVDLRPMSLGERPLAPPAVYTAGYQDKSVDGFFDGMLRAGIQAIMDVRANPISRKYGFARSSIRSIAEKLGLDYSHLPRLGIPSVHRVGLSDEASYARLLDSYESKMLPCRQADVEELARLVSAKPSVLVCMERDVRCCHRSRLAAAVARVSSLPIRHLD
ncbi:MAG TPA: DUF488 family protein [Phycisphaerae bacterium]|nr:DUF488 family protein [Phycisphaerae bacterium]